MAPRKKKTIPIYRDQDIQTDVKGAKKSKVKALALKENNKKVLLQNLQKAFNTKKYQAKHPSQSQTSDLPNSNKENIAKKPSLFDLTEENSSCPEIIGQTLLETLPGIATPPKAVYTPESTLKEENLSITSTPNIIREAEAEAEANKKIESKRVYSWGKQDNYEVLSFEDFLEKFQKKNKTFAKRVNFHEGPKQNNEKLSQQSKITTELTEAENVFVEETKKSLKLGTPLEELPDKSSTEKRKSKNKLKHSKTRRKRIKIKQSSNLLNYNPSEYPLTKYLNKQQHKNYKLWKRVDFENYLTQKVTQRHDESLLLKN
ncbi:hypothetical protein CANARDRAFT_23791 [[Candida] arabinofermentans NRRL YB-2248]|uniref:Uncharacterized protein n=1 Tax=[Candida] arabinofermentans NRRL YB-2248 TaxID=983967 RepID=A0A1E4SZ86_9ASCO|nr:hypothetical protein CANARDRAFT_23791 [[Candida] arabinofermentans NRRL YB-2248]